MALQFDSTNLQANMNTFASKFDAAVRILCENGSQKMEQYAKENRPWTDRTGSARQRLKGSWEKVREGYMVKISHGVNYGVWLEFAHERKYAILLPTIENVAKAQILPAFRNLVDKCKV